MVNNVFDKIGEVLEYSELIQERDIHLAESDIHIIAEILCVDLEARMMQDPACLSAEYVYQSNSFRAILTYRIAHFLYEKGDLLQEDRYRLAGYCLSEASAAKTAIEIHPGAKIGSAFVIDHGVNTLIGATAEIGDHCTILHNVVLGARKITYNASGKRHPTIGNNVHISGGVRILGPVRVGNDVVIGPDCLVLKDVPDHSNVKLLRAIQVTEANKIQHSK